MAPTHRTLLVTGASGHLGRRVVELLLESGNDRVVATTRTPQKLADLEARGVEVREADYERPDTLPRAFAGADRMLLISTDVVDGTDRRKRQHLAAVEGALRAGVKHVVYTSLLRPEPGSPIALAPDHYATEQALASSPMSWTVLRNSVYADGLPYTLTRAVATGKHVSAAGTGAVAYVLRDDCARAAAAALAAQEARRSVLDVTGAELLTQADLVRMVVEITGKPVTYVPVDQEAIVAGLVAAGLPEVVARVYSSFDVGIAQGTLALVSAAFRDLTGRDPQSVRTYLREMRQVLLG